MGYSPTLRNAKLDANSTIIGSAGLLKIFAGTKPATGGADGTLLATFTLGSPFAPASAAGVQSPTLPSATTGSATGTAGWARVTKSDGTTYCMDLTVSTTGAQINLSTISITSGGAVSISSWSITDGNP